MDLENDDAQISAFIDRSERPIKQRRKPGPEKKSNPLSRKISLRVSESDYQQKKQHLRQRGVQISKALRGCFEAMYTNAADDKLAQFSDKLAESLDTTDLPADKQAAITSSLRETIHKHGLLLLLLILMGCGSLVGAVRWYSGIYDGTPIVINKGEVAVYEGGPGFIIRPALKGEHGL